MPTREILRRKYAKRFAHATLVAYVMLAIAGAIGTTWPPDGSLTGWAYYVTRLSGALALSSGVLAAYASHGHRRRWLLELRMLPLLSLGLTGYGAVLLFHVGPQREWLLMTALIGALLGGIAARGSVLSDKVTRRTAAKIEADAQGG